MRLVNWDKVLEWMHRQKETTEQWSMRIAIENYVDDMPTVDAVEVVRCKDCKWGERTRLKQDGTDDMRYRRDYCTLYSRRHEPSYFCADGERREDETN